MADAITLFENGYFAGGISLIYNASTQTTYRSLYGMQIQNSDTSVLMHVPDYGEARPIRAVDLDRVFFFELNVEGSSNDTTANAMARLMRWVDGANQPALRYHLLNDAVELRLRILLDGATNHTESSVKWGFVDAGAAWFNAPAMVNDIAFGVVVALHLSPYSEGASISLHNDLSNGDFLVESGTTGLAQDWSALGGFTGYTLDTTDYLVNGVSQAMTVAGSGEGVGSTVGSVNNGVSMVAFVWIQVASGTWTVRIRNVTDVTVLTSKNITTNDSGGVSDASIVDRQGSTWYRVTLSGTNSTGSAKDFSLDVLTSSASGTANIDAAYMEVGQSTVPAGGWCSRSDLDNRADETNANMGRRNWIDTALIPGDAPALVRYKTDTTAGSGLSWYLTRWRDGKILAADNTHWIESGSFADPVGEDTNGSWSETTGDGNYSGGNYWRFAASGGVGSGPIRYVPSGDTARQLYTGPKALYVQCSSDDATLAATVSASLNNSGGGGINSISSKILVASDSIHIVPVGVLYLTLPEGSEIPDSTEPSTISIDIDVSAIPDTKDINIDGLWLFPLSEDEFHIWSSLLSGTDAWFDGKFERIVESQKGIEEPKVLGSKKWRLEPGLVTNRTMFVWTRSRTTHTITIADTNVITVEIWPRTRQLLGTI